MQGTVGLALSVLLLGMGFRGGSGPSLGSPCCVGLLCLEDSPPGDLNLHLAPPMLGKESFACRYPIINLHMQGQGSAGSQLLPVPSLGLCPSILVILQVEFVPL